MSLEDQIREVLFSIGKEIKILKIDNNNTIISIDYDKYVSELKSILEGYIDTPTTLKQVCEPLGACPVLAKVRKQCLILHSIYDST